MAGLNDFHCFIFLHRTTARCYLIFIQSCTELCSAHYRVFKAWIHLYSKMELHLLSMSASNMIKVLEHDNMPHQEQYNLSRAKSFTYDVIHSGSSCTTSLLPANNSACSICSFKPIGTENSTFHAIVTDDSPSLGLSEILMG